MTNDKIDKSNGSGGQGGGGGRPVTVRIGGEGYESIVQAGGHAFSADEPRSAGGTDRGPTPYDLLLAGLGSCTVMTMRMYADRKGWPLEGAMVTLSHRRSHIEDCEGCTEEDRRITEIELQIELKGDELTDEQRERLLEIADKCPVHRTLAGKIAIKRAEAPAPAAR